MALILNSASGYPEPKPEPPELFPVARCKACHGDIWPGETYGLDDGGGAVCIDCARDEWLTLTAGEQLERLGYFPVYDLGEAKRRHFIKQ